MIKQIDAQELSHNLDSYVELLCDVVENGASVNFIAPMSKEDAVDYWRRIAEQIERGERVVLVDDEAGLRGCVHLIPATTPNGRHRAEVQKVLVHSSQRRRGIGKALMNAIEAQARQMGIKLLVLDTERDSSGEALYTACGWQRAGVIPQFALNHDGSKYVDTVYFYKLLGNE